MISIELDRQFVEVAEGKETDPDMVARFGRLTGGALDWKDLLTRRRVVLLAEAGSGKTTEMTAHARQQAEAGEYSFYSTVEDVGQRGLVRALRVADRALLEQWRMSDKDGWFFVDSVDEAKQSGVRLKVVLRALADELTGAERRAHIILSGRYSDWQFRRDLADLREELSIPADDTLPPPPTPDELIINTIHHNRPPDPAPPEEPTVVVMAGLDEKRVRRFAAGKNITSLDTFIAQLDEAGLWQFARRPLDLDWLVQFWQTYKRLGTLAEMLDVCISERLQEPNLDRARTDSLDVARAYCATERIGAALIFTRRDTIAVPDPEIDFTDSPSQMDIASILPDWSPQDRERLLTRAVFDPATLGRVRIHNDNQGVVRSFLTARWLRRLRQHNLSQRDLFDLLFGIECGVQVIKPSLQATAAWLAIWDDAVAREVAQREPFLLLDTGDPGSLSAQTREAVLSRVVERIAGGGYVPTLDNDNLKRFARHDLGPMVRRLWVKHINDEHIRRLLLRIIWLGKLGNCADIAVGVALNPSTDQREAAFAGRALTATGDAAAKDQYAGFIREYASRLSSTVLWDATDDLFPRHLSADDLLEILNKVNVEVNEGGLGFDWYGPKLISRLSSRADLERLLIGFLSRMEGHVAADAREATPRESAYFPAIAAASERLLDISGIDAAPMLAIEAAVRLGRAARVSRIARKRAPDVVSRLEASTPRRRAAFWGFTELLADHPMLGGRPIQSLWDLQMLGWSIKLSRDDVDWLLSDAPARPRADQRLLAIHTALALFHDAGWPEGSEQRVRAVAEDDPAMSKAVTSWFSPPKMPAAPTESERRLDIAVHQNAIERAKQDQSWIDFAAGLRANPANMRDLRPTTDEGCDSKLYHLYMLLNQTIDADRRYAISSVNALLPMIGSEATEGFRLGLIAHWRARSPWLHSTRETRDLNQIRWLDAMGLAGITLERASGPNWAPSLTEKDVRLAAGYATLELNGFPDWLSELAQAKPLVVRDVLVEELRAEWDRPADAPRFGVLQNLARGDRVLAELVAPSVLTALEKRPDMPTTILSNAIDIVIRGPVLERERLKDWLLKRFYNEHDPARSRLFIAALFSINGAAACDAVFIRLGRLKKIEQPTFVQSILPNIFGGGFSSDTPVIEGLSLPNLERLVKLAFTAVRVEDDVPRKSGVAFSPTQREDAERARGAAFSRLLHTPGRAAFNAILNLRKVQGFPIDEARLRQFAKEHAARTADFTAWKPSEVIEFEKTAQAAPQTTRELQLVGLRRITDLQYDLIHDDFQQGKTLAQQETEKDVQKFIADRLRLTQGHLYSVEREVHVADEKEPDVRLRAKATDASVPIEIKVAESWTLPQLEDALITQLCGKYLRARDARNGILLLVHNRPKPKGWARRAGKMLAFPAVVARLQKLAIRIAGSEEDAPQPEMATLDMTSFSGKMIKLKSVEKASPKRAALSKKAKPAAPQPMRNTQRTRQKATKRTKR
jgi:hypothetical protein